MGGGINKVMIAVQVFGLMLIFKMFLTSVVCNNFSVSSKSSELYLQAPLLYRDQ